MQDKIFYSSCFGFVFGVLLGSFVFVDFYLVILFGILAFVLFFFFSLVSKNKWGIIASIFILSFSFGIWRFQIFDTGAPKIFESEVGQKVSIRGIISDEPDIRENNQKLNVQTKVSQESVNILVTTNFDQDFKYGDQINFEGVLQKPQNFITDQGKEFDYVNYLRKDGIFYVINYPKVEIVSRGNGSKIKSALFFAKQKFLEKMNFAIAEPENLLMGGLILGEKSSFNQDLRASFVNTGTIHIVALSGYNITIVSQWFMKLFSFLPKNLAIGMGILSILLFILMTGGSSTAIRAGIMATLALIARATGRTYDVARALILAGVIMLFVNPLTLVYDVSFELSFIATVAVIFFAPRIEKYFLWVTPKLGLRDIVSVTCATYIFILPFILYKMGNLSLVALPANILILPFIPFTMALGFFTGFAALLWYIIALPLGYISYLMLHYELWVINFFSHLPLAAFVIPDFPLLFTLLTYAYFIYRLFGRNIWEFFKN